MNERDVGALKSAWLRHDQRLRRSWIESRTRQQQALALRRSGLSCAEVARRLRYPNARAVRQAVRRELDRRYCPLDLQIERYLLLERVEELYYALSTGRITARRAEVLLRAAALRRVVLGLDRLDIDTSDMTTRAGADKSASLREAI